MLTSPEGRLCLAILLQAINDMTKHTKSAPEARRWVCRMRRTFLMCADVLEVDEIDLRKRILLIVKQGGLDARHLYGKPSSKAI